MIRNYPDRLGDAVSLPTMIHGQALRQSTKNINWYCTNHIFVDVIFRINILLSFTTLFETEK